MKLKNIRIYIKIRSSAQRRYGRNLMKSLLFRIGKKSKKAFYYEIDERKKQSIKRLLPAYKKIKKS